MNKFALIACLSLFLGVAVGQSCWNKPDGRYPLSCKMYYDCKNNIATTHECPWGTAYDFASKNCISPSEINSPCGFIPDCSKIPDGTYPVPNHCDYMYTCYQNTFYGIKFCNNPYDSGLLVFDQKNVRCDWKANVPPPCGTA